MFQATLTESKSFHEVFHTTSAVGQDEMRKAFYYGVWATEVAYRRLGAGCVMAKTSVLLVLVHRGGCRTVAVRSRSGGRKTARRSWDSNRKSGPWMRTVEKAACRDAGSGPQPTAKPVKLVVTVYRRPGRGTGTGRKRLSCISRRLRSPDLPGHHEGCPRHRGRDERGGLGR